MRLYNLLILILALLAFQGCGGDPSNGGGASGGENPPSVSPPAQDGAVVRGMAIYNVSTEEETALMKLFNKLIPKAYAASGSTTVTYVNAASVSFTINVTNFGPAGFTGDTLSLGQIGLASLSDNHLKVCGNNNNQKCNKAIIRVYTLGSIEGFVNVADGYGVPVYAGSLNPNMPVGLNAANSVQVQTFNIASNDNKITIADFPNPNYNVTSDFSNAGSGSYSMTFVVEYALSL